MSLHQGLVMNMVSPEMKAWQGFVLTDEYLKKCNQPSFRYLTGKCLDIREKIWKAFKQ